MPENAIYVRTEGKNGENVFKNIWIRVDVASVIWYNSLEVLFTTTEKI